MGTEQGGAQHDCGTDKLDPHDKGAHKNGTGLRMISHVRQCNEVDPENRASG